MSAIDAHLTESQLGDLADGTLAAAEREETERHVAACAACRQAVAESRAVLAMARSARGGRGVAAPAELWPLVAASTVHAARLRRRTLRSMRGLLVVAAAALVLGTAAVTAAVTAWLRPAPTAEAMDAVRRAEGDARRAMERQRAAAAGAERGLDAARRDAARGDPSRHDVGRGDPSRHDAGPPPSAPRPPSAPVPPGR